MRLNYKKLYFISTIIFSLIFILSVFIINIESREKYVYFENSDGVVNLDESDSVDVFCTDENEEILIRTNGEKYELKSIDNIPKGEVLRVIYSSDKSILLSNTKFLVHIDVKNDMKEKFIDLSKLDNVDSDRSEINVDRKGENIIYSSFNEKENKKNVYYVDINDGSGIKIGETAIEDFVDSWSYNSNYYVFGDKEGKRVSVFDKSKLEVNNINFKRDFLKKVLVTDKGEVFVEGNKKYVIKKEKNYELAECVIAGSFIGINGNTVITYKNGVINSYSEGSINRINEIPETFKVMRQIKDNLVLSDESSTIIYNIKNNEIHKYSFKYEYLDMIIPSNFGEKCLIKSKRYNNRIVGSNGQYYKVQDTNLMKIIGECSWVNEKEIVGIYYNEEDKPIIIRVEV